MSQRPDDAPDVNDALRGAGPPPRRIAVIGGGLAGLMAAKALEEKGASVCLLESASRLGGVVQTTATEGYLHEQAASSFLAKPGGMLALCRDLEVPVVKASPAARRRWIFLDGKRREVPSGPLSLLTTDLLTWRGKLDLLREPLRPARRVDQAGDESVYDFAARRFGAQMARALVSPFVGGIFAADAHDVSLEAGFPQLAELDAAGGVLRGQLKKMFGGRRTTTAAAAAADKTPKLAKGERGLWAPAGGMAMVIQALAAQLQSSDVRLGSKVVELIPRSGAVAVVTEVSTGRATATTRERFAGVVVALPATHAARLVPSLPEAGRRLGELARSPAAVVSLGYHIQDFREIGLDGFGMLIAAGEKARTLGIVFESVLWPGRAPADRVLLRCILGGARDPDAFALTDAQLIAAATEDVATTLGVRAEPVHALATRWAEGIAPFRVGHRQRVLEATNLLRSQRIALAGADYRGVGMNGGCQDPPAVVAEAMAWT